MFDFCGAPGFVLECPSWLHDSRSNGAVSAHPHKSATSRPHCGYGALVHFFAEKEIDPEQLRAGIAAVAGVKCLTGGQPEKQLM